MSKSEKAELKAKAKAQKEKEKAEKTKENIETDKPDDEIAAADNADIADSDATDEILQVKKEPSSSKGTSSKSQHSILKSASEKSTSHKRSVLKSDSEEEDENDDSFEDAEEGNNNEQCVPPDEMYEDESGSYDDFPPSLPIPVDNDSDRYDRIENWIDNLQVPRPHDLQKHYDHLQDDPEVNNMSKIPYSYHLNTSSDQLKPLKEFDTVSRYIASYPPYNCHKIEPSRLGFRND